MVSDYKFHLFCKRLKKEKWRPNRDLSMPATGIFHSQCPREEAQRDLFRAGRYEPLCLWDSVGAICGKSERSREVFVSQKSWQIPSGSEFEDSLPLQRPGLNQERSNARVCMGPGRQH